MENSDRAIDAVMGNENGEKVVTAHRQETPEIDTLKRDIDQPPNDESILSGTSTIQAPLQPTGPIDALELSDENVDGAENIYNSKAVLVPAPRTKSNDDLKNTLKERWRVPTLTVKPLDDTNSVSQVESSVI